MDSTQANTKHIDSILSEWKTLIGQDYEGYRNHVVRMVTFCLMLRQCNSKDQQKIEIAACFHDIGIWIDNTLDYLPPSVPPAQRYLVVNGLEDWSEEITQMILEHHNIKPVNNGLSPLVELFRQGDLIDFSLGLVKFSLSKNLVKQIKKEYPNKGFHKTLVKRAISWFVKHPLNPAPMMKW